MFFDTNDASARISQALDRIAGCAATSLGAPLGLVSLIDGDALLLAGLHGFEQRRTVRAGSCCDEVVRLGTKLQVGDAADDPRFCQHEFVAQGGVRGYAGAPVRAVRGPIVGTVAVFTGTPGAFPSAALDDLEALAHMASMMLTPPEIALPRIRGQGWIGIRTLDAARTETAARAGLVVLSVAKDSPAAAAGLRAADILFTVDDHLLRDRADLVAALADRETGSSVRLTFQRAGQWMERWVRIATKSRKVDARIRLPDGRTTQVRHRRH